MRTAIFGGVMLAGLALGIPQAHAIGCLSGGAAGALAGHMAGHGVLGAIGGCIAGHQWHKHQLRQQDLESTSAYEARRKQYDPNYQNPYRR
jgi:hypothetical protein